MLELERILGVIWYKFPSRTGIPTCPTLTCAQPLSCISSNKEIIGQVTPISHRGAPDRLHFFTSSSSQIVTYVSDTNSPGNTGGLLR